MFYLRCWPTRIGAEGYISGVCSVTGLDHSLFSIEVRKDGRGYPYPMDWYDVYGPEAIQQVSLAHRIHKK